MQKIILLIATLATLLIGAYYGLFYVFQTRALDYFNDGAIHFETRDELFNTVPRGSDKLIAQNALNAYKEYVAKIQKLAPWRNQILAHGVT